MSISESYYCFLKSGSFVVCDYSLLVNCEVHFRFVKTRLSRVKLVIVQMERATMIFQSSSMQHARTTELSSKLSINNKLNDRQPARVLVCIMRASERIAISADQLDVIYLITIHL